MNKNQDHWLSLLVALLLLLVAFVGTLLTELVPVGGKPQIANTFVMCNTTAGYVPPAAPTHNLGLPFSYVTHFNNTGCGYVAQMKDLAFWADYAIWVLVLLALWWMVRLVRSKATSSH